MCCTFLGITQVLIIIPFKFIELFAHVFFKLLGIFDEAYDFFLKFYVLGAHLGSSQLENTSLGWWVFGGREHIPVVLAFLIFVIKRDVVFSHWLCARCESLGCLRLDQSTGCVTQARLGGWMQHGWARVRWAPQTGLLVHRCATEAKPGV